MNATLVERGEEAAMPGGADEVGPVRLLGPDPFSRDGRGGFQPQVATVFPGGKTIATLPGIHATQRSAYVDDLDAAHQREGRPPLSEKLRSEVWQSAVDVIIQRETVHIRPDPEQIPLAFEADELLQQLVPKHRIRYLLAGNERVRDAIKRRGELWRITSRPISTLEMVRMIQDSRMAIEGREIYFHSPSTGTRLLTCQAFHCLGELSDKELQDHLIEIQYYSHCMNRLGKPEIDFFIAGRKIRDPLTRPDFSVLGAQELRQLHAALSRQFTNLIPIDLRGDDPQNIEWRNRLTASLQPLDEDRVLEEQLLGLASEFHMHIEWLPGGRIEAGELIIDSVYDAEPSGAGPGDVIPRDEKARGLIFNYVRDYADLEYINVGRVAEQLTRGRRSRGRREVYVVEMKRQSDEHEIIKIIRLQKWDTSRHLDDGWDLLDSMRESEAYTEYILDRRLGCRRLGMNLPQHLGIGRLSEIYNGPHARYRGTRIWTPYFERDYFHGIATDKIPLSRFQREEYALKFARLLGTAAAANMIVGRCDDDGRVFFDDGDEVIREDHQGLPVELTVTHHTGAFADYKSDLSRFAAAYAAPINSRLAHVPCPREFMETYLTALAGTLARTQAEYRRRRRAFDTLFQHRDCNPNGSYAFRWERVLQRLRETDANGLAAAIQAAIRVANPPG